MNTYRLIDGAFFVGLFRQWSNDIFGEESHSTLLNAYNWEAFGSGVFRKIYYDALPVQKTDQTDEEFKRSIGFKTSFLNEFRRRSNYSVRDGVTRLRTSARAIEMGRVMEQKGVDTWIAVDAIRLAMSNQAAVIEVWTSDSDLYPVFEALQSTGAKGRLRYDPRITSDELVYSADEADPISFSILARYFSNEFEKKFACSWENLSYEDYQEGIEGEECLIFDQLDDHYILYSRGAKRYYYASPILSRRYPSASSNHPYSLMEFVNGYGAHYSRKHIRNAVKKFKNEHPEISLN